MNSIKKLLVILFLSLTQCGFGQVIVGVKYIGLSGHLKKSPHPHLYTLKLDKKGFLVANTGIVITAELFVYKNIVSVKFGQSFMFDCARQMAGFTHLGLRVSGYHNRHTASIGNGPTLFYRKDWKDLPGYVDEGLFKRYKNYQYRFFWYAGEVEYNYYMTSKYDLSLSLIPGPPEFFTLAPGIRLR